MDNRSGAGANGPGGGEGPLFGGGGVEPGDCTHRMKFETDGVLVCSICGFRKLPREQTSIAEERAETKEEKRIRRMRSRDGGGLVTRSMKRAERRELMKAIATERLLRRLARRLVRGR